MHVAQLGIAYRRIPILAIGRDVYLDTRLILQKLEEFYPPSEAHPSIAGRTDDQRATQRLLAHLMMDGGVFGQAARLMPPDLPLLRDARFVKDRADLVGNGSDPFKREVLLAGRPEALIRLRNAVELLETSLLADGRDWVLKSEGPTLADIEAVWVIHWIINIPGAVPSEVINAEKFPRVFAWLDSFSRAVEVKGKQLGELRTVKGDEAADLVVSSAFAEPSDGGVDGADPVVAAQSLRQGDLVQLWPTDTGSRHKDLGTLISMTPKEIVIETQSTRGAVRVHAPRTGFRVRKQEGGPSKL